MDKASAYGAGDYRFEPYRGHLINAKTCVLSLIVGRRRHAWICAMSSPGVEPLDDKDTAQGRADDG